jgi:diadenosine tetraphosphatase ApaH/serine/threonine PP2A family protein phosphatase
MTHEVETMAFAHAVPWHGLGVRVAADTKPEDMAKAAGIDWEVEKRPILTSRGSWMLNPGETSSFGPDDLQLIKGRQALTRVTDGKVFDIVGERWKPVQNRDLLATFKKFCDEGGATMETAGALRGWPDRLGPRQPAQRLRAARRRRGEGLPAAGLQARGRVRHHRPGHPGAGGLRQHLRDERRVRRRRAAARPAHHGVRPDLGRRADGPGPGRHDRVRANAALLQKLNISRDDAIRILAPVYQPQDDVADVLKDFDANASRTVKAIMDAAMKGAGQAEIAGTGLGLFNGCTYYANHTARGSADNRFASTLVGQNNLTLNRTFKGLLELTDAA